jgi:hypothetical protein
MSFSHLPIQAGFDVEARPSGFGKKQANEAKVAMKYLMSTPDVIPQFLNRIIRLFNCSRDCIVKLFRLF